MTQEEILKKSYEFCLEQGWVHNTPIENVLSDYFNTTDGRKTLFDTHFNKIFENSDCHEINILIGEAPPYYPNSKYPKKKNRQYFYDSEQSLDTPYFKEPCKHFLNIPDWEDEKKKNPTKTKADYLQELADKGVLIFDIFPFPIFQSTNIRENIVKENEQSTFLKYLNHYFKPRLDILFHDLSQKKQDLEIKIYLFAPKLASIQFLFWFKDNDFYKHLIKFKNSGFAPSQDSKSKKGRDILFINKSLDKFVIKISNEDKKIKDEFIEVLLEHPILMNDSGNPDFNNFVNGKK